MTAATLPARDWSGGVVAYPDPAIETIDARFDNYRIGNAAVERLCTGMRWAEGPVWFGDGRYLLWSDIPNNRIMRWSEENGAVSVYRSPSNNSNGHTRDRQGRLISCEHGARRVTRTEYDGTVTVLMDRYQGKRLNAPNDVVVHSDGSIWFTDPGYGIMLDYEGERANFELPCNVYRLDPVSGKAEVVADDFVKPNGLCFSPDEKRLYIVDTGRTEGAGGPPHIRAFDVDGPRLRHGRLFIDMQPASADGIRTDVDGNLWTSVGWGSTETNGVRCYTPGGELIGAIHLPEPCSNLCFGGWKKSRLFMTCGMSVYALYTATRGAQTP